MIENEGRFNQEGGSQIERFIVKDMKPFDNVLDFGKRIDPDILEKPFDLVVAELDRISFDLNQVHLRKTPTVFDLKDFETVQYSNFLIAKNLFDETLHILKQKQGQRVSFIDGQFVKYSCDIWQGYCLTGKNEFVLSEDYSCLDPNIFNPENLARNGELVKSDKRNIYRLETGESIFYIKSSNILLRPRYNIDFYDMFESFPTIEKLDSKVEAERFLQLAELGVNVPRVIGYSVGQVSDILVVENINGDHPTGSDYLENRFNILGQDRQILVALNTLGLEKRGFEDFDDKILKDGKLYLIDVDECIEK